MLIEEVNQRLLFDKLCARWRAESASVELYGHAIRLAEQEGADEGVIERLAGFQRQEKAHEEYLEEVCRRFGWAFSALTESSELARREMEGLIEICSAPGATMHRAMHCLLDAELVDATGWELLEDLCKQATIDEDVVRQFRRAWREEKEHVHFIKTHLMERERKDLKLEPFEWDGAPA
jgi:hypothetical protein